MTMRVLIIDDEDEVRFVIRVSLGRLGGMTVMEAPGGEEGLAIARAERPDLILLDMMMPGLDGPATFEVLRADDQTKSIPVVFLTANALAMPAEQMLALGAKAVILKPFDPMSLAERVAAIMST